MITNKKTKTWYRTVPARNYKGNIYLFLYEEILDIYSPIKRNKQIQWTRWKKSKFKTKILKYKKRTKTGKLYWINKKNMILIYELTLFLPAKSKVKRANVWYPTPSRGRSHIINYTGRWGCRIRYYQICRNNKIFSAISKTKQGKYVCISNINHWNRDEIDSLTKTSGVLFFFSTYTNYCVYE